MNGFMEKELNTSIRTLDILRRMIVTGEFDGWGLDDNMVLCVKQWLENIKEGIYEE